MRRRLGRALGPIREARGFPRVMLYIGFGITVFFVLMAILAPLISPYDFDQYKSGNQPLPAARGAVARPPDGHDRPVDRRALAGDLGRADRAQGRDHLARLRPDRRRPARPPLRLLRREARPRARPRHGRAVRLPVPAARDRDRLPALEQHRQGGAHGRDRDLGRLRAALLPRRPEPGDRAARGVVRRGGARARREAVHDHPQVRLLQRRPERPADRDAERGRRDPRADGARVPRLRDPADRRGRVGLRHPARGLGHGVGDLVDGPLPRARDRPARHRADAARRGPERDDEPGAPQAAVREGRRSVRRAGEPAALEAGAARRDPLRPRPAGPLRHDARHRARGRPRLARHRRRRGARPRRRVGLREVDARPRDPRAAARGRGGQRRGALRRPEPRRDVAEGALAGCAGPTSA